MRSVLKWIACAMQSMLVLSWVRIGLVWPAETVDIPSQFGRASAGAFCVLFMPVGDMMVTLLIIPSTVYLQRCKHLETSVNNQS